MAKLHGGTCELLAHRQHAPVRPHVRSNDRAVHSVWQVIEHGVAPSEVYVAPVRKRMAAFVRIHIQVALEDLRERREESVPCAVRFCRGLDSHTSGAGCGPEESAGEARSRKRGERGYSEH